MNTITIPKNLAKNDDLVVIPRKEYNVLLELKKIIPIITATKKDIATIRRGEKEIKRGEFLTSKQVKKMLPIS